MAYGEVRKTFILSNGQMLYHPYIRNSDVIVVFRKKWGSEVCALNESGAVQIYRHFYRIKDCYFMIDSVKYKKLEIS